MPRAKLIRYFALWLALALGGECYIGVAYAVHAGYFGGLSIGTGPVSVLVVEESSEREKLTPGQLDIIGSHSPGSFLDWIKTHGEKGDGGAYRIVDKDDAMGQDEPKWKALFEAKGREVPWLVVGRNGRVLLSEALPKSEEEFMRVVRRFGGQ